RRRGATAREGSTYPFYGHERGLRGGGGGGKHDASLGAGPVRTAPGLAVAGILFVIGSILIFAVQVFVLLVFIRVILPWVYAPYASNRFARLLMLITEPVLGPIRRRLPPIAGMDLSPVVVWVGAGVLISLLRFIL